VIASATLNDLVDLTRYLYGFDATERMHLANAMEALEDDEAYSGEIWLEVSDESIRLGPIVNGDRIESGVEELRFPFDPEDLVSAIRETQEIVQEIDPQ